MKYDLIRPCSN